MRHWLMVLMIALLPLRGWAGDAMTLSMWSSPGSPHSSAAPCHTGADQNTSSTKATASEHSHAAMAMGMDQHGDAADHSSHVGCNACDICNVPALSPVAQKTRATEPRHTHRASEGERFASAEPQRSSKPPIA